MTLGDDRRAGLLAALNHVVADPAERERILRRHPRSANSLLCVSATDLRALLLSAVGMPHGAPAGQPNLFAAESISYWQHRRAAYLVRQRLAVRTLPGCWRALLALSTRDVQVVCVDIGEQLAAAALAGAAKVAILHELNALTGATAGRVAQKLARGQCERMEPEAAVNWRRWMTIATDVGALRLLRFGQAALGALLGELDDRQAAAVRSAARSGLISGLVGVGRFFADAARDQRVLERILAAALLRRREPDGGRTVQDAFEETP